MNEQELELFNIASFEDFEAGASSTSSFDIEDGMYDAQCVGTVVENATYEGKTKVVVRLLWQFKQDDQVHTVRGNSWTLSSNEKSKFRKDVSDWFDKTDWADVCAMLVKMGVIVKNEDGSARFDVDKFIDRKARLMIGNQKSKTSGKKYPVIKQISPSKAKTVFEYDEVPYFMVEGKDIIKYKLKDGVAIRKKKADGESSTAQVNTMPPATEDDDELPFDLP